MKIEGEPQTYCPVCKSTSVTRRQVYVSVYGSIPEIPKDFCRSCGFNSYEKFENLNFINTRNDKLTKILDNGIQ